jgi:hypothetical protein
MLTAEQRTKAGKAGGYANRTFEQRSKAGKTGGSNSRKSWNEKVARGEIPHQTLGLKKTEEQKKRISEYMKGVNVGSKNGAFGTCWISNLDEKRSIRLKRDLAEELLASGWIKGKKF